MWGGINELDVNELDVNELDVNELDVNRLWADLGIEPCEGGQGPGLGMSH